MFPWIYCLISIVFAASGHPLNRKPNIIWILTDDQDVVLNGLETMNQTRKLLYDQGLVFNNAFVSSPLGRYVHNTYTFNNSAPGGCQNPDTWNNNVEKRTYAVQAQNAGYRTLYAGKYLNQYGYKCCGGMTHIPPGWTDWYTLQDNSRYYNYKISDNGKILSFGSNYSTDYLPDNIHRRAIKFLDNQPIDKPFLMVLATPTCHDPFTPAPQYNDTDAGQISPRVATWDLTGTDVSDHHQLIREVPAMTPLKINQSDAIYRYRHGALRSVDDMIEDIYNKVDSMGLLNVTYFIYFSDHGFHLGEFGMHFDKRQLYETDLRVPMVVKGPGVPIGKSTASIAVSIDIAATIAEITTSTVPQDMDGLSMVPILFDGEWQNNSTYNTNNQQFFVEYYGEQGNSDSPFSNCSCAIPGFVSAVCDKWNNTYKCVRSKPANSNNGTIYCKFTCFDEGKNEVECPADKPEGQGEYYNLDKDFWGVNNTWSSLNNNDKAFYQDFIDKFAVCKGQNQCNELRLTNGTKTAITLEK
eukprot:45228_1